MLKACEIDDYESLFSHEVRSSHELSVSEVDDSALRKPNFEQELQISHCKIIMEYETAVQDFYQHPSCSCGMLFKKGVSILRFPDNLGTKVWSVLKDFILSDDSKAAEKSFFMCHYCKGAIKKDKMLSHCVLNGLKIVDVPSKLAKLG